MARQLNLDRDKLDACYNLSQQVISHAAKYIERHSSPAVERATLMLLGVEGDHRGQHLASWMVQSLTKDQLRLGAAYWWGRALLGLKEEDPKKLAERLGRGKIKWTDLPEVPPQELRKNIQTIANDQFKKLDEIQSKTQKFKLPWRVSQPQVGVSIKEEKLKKIPSRVEESIKEGTKICLLAFAPKSFQEEAWGVGDLERVAGHVKTENIVWGTGGLSGPEQILYAIQNGFSAFQLDGFAPILSGALDPKRALVDHSFALSLCRRWSNPILNEETLGLAPPQLLALLLLYEQMARRQGLDFSNIMLHFSPEKLEKENRLFAKIAFVQILRETFYQSPLWMSCENGSDGLMVWLAAFTGQDVLLFSNPNPTHLQSAKNYLTGMEGFGDEFALNLYGKIARESHQILDQTWKLLRQIQQLTLWKTFDEDALAPKMEGKKAGGEGVFQKSFHYFNPVTQLCPVSESY